jgi:hypothetical protein
MPLAKIFPGDTILIANLLCHGRLLCCYRERGKLPRTRPVFGIAHFTNKFQLQHLPKRKSVPIALPLEELVVWRVCMNDTQYRY